MIRLSLQNRDNMDGGTQNWQCTLWYTLELASNHEPSVVWKDLEYFCFQTQKPIFNMATSAARFRLQYVVTVCMGLHLENYYKLINKWNNSTSDTAACLLIRELPDIIVVFSIWYHNHTVRGWITTIVMSLSHLSRWPDRCLRFHATVVSSSGLRPPDKLLHWLFGFHALHRRRR